MELLPDLKLHHPKSVEDAVSLHATATSGRYLAGGSDLLVNIRRGIEQPESLVYLSNIAEMQAITDAPGQISIG
ncbi:MAG: FAD binding domain-containing protein, partial [Alphaproteobacteria bacterium]|nr:FAD binding domain-containing protein [Alphaproteobacteria bacterium]